MSTYPPAEPGTMQPPAPKTCSALRVPVAICGIASISKIRSCSCGSGIQRIFTSRFFIGVQCMPLVLGYILEIRFVGQSVC